MKRCRSISLCWHPYCRWHPPDKGLPWQQTSPKRHCFMAFGGGIQPKISVHQCRVCTFKILLTISETLRVLKGKCMKWTRNLQYHIAAFIGLCTFCIQSGTKLSTPSWILIQRLKPSQCWSYFYLKQQSSQSGTQFGTPKGSHTADEELPVQPMGSPLCCQCCHRTAAIVPAWHLPGLWDSQMPRVFQRHCMAMCCQLNIPPGT